MSEAVQHNSVESLDILRKASHNDGNNDLFDDDDDDENGWKIIMMRINVVVKK